MLYVQDCGAGKFLSQNSNTVLHAPHIVGILYTTPQCEKVEKQKYIAYCIG